MEVTVNQESYQVPDTCTVEHLLTAVLSRSAKGIAVAVNQAIVPRTNWAAHLLHPSDQVIVIKATQGG